MPRRLSLLWAILVPMLALADEPVIRSLGDNRVRQFNELSLPRFRSRQTSRGWEIRTRHATILAPTEQQAETTATHVLKIWQRTRDLVEQWSPRQAGANFAVGTVQVLVDNRPPRGQRDLPTMTIGDRASILLYINTAANDRSLDAQLPRLGLGASRAFFAASGLDRQLPEWVVNGLSAHVVKQELGQDKKLQPLFLATSRQSNQVTDNASELKQATNHVRFLLTGDDAAHAVSFLSLLARSGRSPANVRTPVNATAREWAALLQNSAEQFERWQENPDAGQPLIEKPSTDADTATREREMAFLLKLAQRQLTKPRSPVQPKVFESGAQGFKSVDVGLAASAPLQRTIRDLQRRALDIRQWATIGPDGNLLFSGTQRMQSTLEELERKYRFRYSDGKMQVIAQTSAQATEEFIAWLEPNSEKPSQPLARFKLAKKGS